jgi:hypothetical protein
MVLSGSYDISVKMMGELAVHQLLECRCCSHIQAAALAAQHSADAAHYLHLQWGCSCLPALVQVVVQVAVPADIAK